VSASADGFLARWSQRKAKQRQGAAPVDPSPPATVRAEPVEAPLPPGPSTSSGRTELGNVAAETAPKTAMPPPTLDDVAALDRDADFRRFVAADATPEVKNAAMRKLFSDPRFNVMDGLDTYIDDYGKPDPIPASMLRQMVQSQALGLFADEEKAALDKPAARATPDGTHVGGAAQSPPETSNTLADDDNAALRLQPLDAAGPPRDPGGSGQDAGRER
jgi:hypothetical protein